MRITICVREQVIENIIALMPYLLIIYSTFPHEFAVIRKKRIKQFISSSQSFFLQKSKKDHAPNELSEYVDVCKELSVKHEKVYSVPCEFGPELVDGEVKIRCQICDLLIKSGLQKQKLFNV